MTTGTLDRYLRDLEARGAFSGVVRITVGEEERFAGAYGFASRAWGVRNTLETRFDTASITKLFTAVATLQQVDAGAFGLGTSAVEYLDLEGTAISPLVTVRHLLTHTSGIGDDADEEAGESYEAIWQERPNYSVIETADFLRMDRVNERLAEGVDPIRDEAGGIVGWKRNVYSYPPIGSPDSGANVTASDLDLFLRAVRDGRLLSAESTAAFLSPQVRYRVRDGWVQHFGYGPWFRVDDDGTLVFLEKEGINAGVSGLVRHYPSRDLTVVMLSNLEQGVWDPIAAAHDMIVAGAFS